MDDTKESEFGILILSPPLLPLSKRNGCVVGDMS